MGYKVAPQHEGELLLDDWARGNMEPIIKIAQDDFNFFQDIPFSLPATFKSIHQALPNSQFILTVRDDEDQWYNSVVRFHSRLIGKGNHPSAADLQNFDYLEPGWMWKAQQLIYGVSAEDPYQPVKLKAFYRKHVEDVRNYFSDHSEQFLELNLGDDHAAQRLSNFIQQPIAEIPWENKS
jgi:hypothetical protein